MDQSRKECMVQRACLLIVLVAGIYLASKLHQWSAFYVQWGLAVAVVLGGLFGAYFIPNERKLGEIAARDVHHHRAAILRAAREVGRDHDLVVRQQLAWAHTHVEIMRYQGLRLLAQLADAQIRAGDSSAAQTTIPRGLEKDPAKQHPFQALQNTFKILLNSFYGYLGFAQGHFADFDAAARVTQIGRDLLKKMIDWLGAHGAKVIEVDTDGIYFVPSGKIEIDELREGLAKELPDGIEIEFDEQFDAMFSYKAKNYALLTKDGDVIIKGGALKSRGLEKFQRVFLEEMIKLIMEGKPEAITNLRDEFERKIRNREWKIDMLMKTDTLQDSLDKYRAKIAGSARNRAAAYELALTSGRNYKPGDQISYYVKATPKKVAAYEAARLASDFDPQNRDENVDYYVAKLDELVKKFGGVTAAVSAPKQESLAF